MKQIITTNNYYFIWILYLLPVGFLISCANDYPCGEPQIGKCSNVEYNYHASLAKRVNVDDLPNSPASDPKYINRHKQQSCISKKPKAKTCIPSVSDPYYNDGNIDNHAIKTYPQIPANGKPLISKTRMLKVWYAPYVDSDNIYHDQNYQYMMIEHPKWIYSSNKYYGRFNKNNSLSNAKLVQNNNLALDQNSNNIHHDNSNGYLTNNNDNNDNKNLDNTNINLGVLEQLNKK